MQTRVVFSILLTMIAAGCRSGGRGVPLPAPIATPVAPSFSGPTAGWPPRPVAVTNEQRVAFTPGALTEEMVPGLRAIAEANAEVRAALGSRFAFVTAGQAEPEKRAVTAVRPFRLVYFSHDRNVGVDVLLDRQQVLRVSEMREYQPPAGLDEMELAVRLARNDPRAARTVANLRGEAIRIDPQPGQPGYGNRVLYVAFLAPDSDHTDYAAIVDLTRQEVLSFNAVSKRSKR